MKTVSILALALFSIALQGCELENRVAKLEKQSQDLKTHLERDNVVRDYDLQTKCSNEARSWVNAYYKNEKNVITLDYTNHYNRSQNACIAVVKLQLNGIGRSGREQDIRMWNVLENSMLAAFLEDHENDGNESKDEVVVCRVHDAHCKSLDEFRQLIAPDITN